MGAVGAVGANGAQQGTFRIFVWSKPPRNAPDAPIIATARARRPSDIRRVLYTTDALENVNRQLRKTLKTRGQFPTDDAATRLIWLALRHHGDMETAGPDVEGRHEPVRHPLRGSLHPAARIECSAVVTPPRTQES